MLWPVNLIWRRSCDVTSEFWKYVQNSPSKMPLKMFIWWSILPNSTNPYLHVRYLPEGYWYTDIWFDNLATGLVLFWQDIRFFVCNLIWGSLLFWENIQIHSVPDTKPNAVKSHAWFVTFQTQCATTVDSWICDDTMYCMFLLWKAWT